MAFFIIIILVLSCSLPAGGQPLEGFSSGGQDQIINFHIVHPLQMFKRCVKNVDPYQYTLSCQSRDLQYCASLRGSFCGSVLRFQGIH